MAYGMIDGFKGGTNIESFEYESNGVLCHRAEARALWSVMEKQPTSSILKPGKEIKLFINPKNERRIKSTIEVSLTEDRRRGGWYFNVMANPNSVFKGHNRTGSLLVVRQVKRMFDFVLNWLKEQGANNIGRLQEAVSHGHIHVYSISFAVYSKPFESSAVLTSMIDRWYAMYETRVWLDKDRRHVSLLDELGLARGSGPQYRDSLPLDIFIGSKGTHGNRLMHLDVYNKVSELRDKGKLAAVSAQEQRDLNKRARLDLTVTNYFFRTRWKLKQVTLRNIWAYVKKRWGDVMWQGAVEEFMHFALRRTCLLYMMNPPNVFHAKHATPLARWQAEETGHVKRQGWSDATKKWAADNGVDLSISSRAHLIMLTGLVALQTNTERNVRDWLGSAEAADKYITSLRTVLARTRESARLAKAAAGMTLDFSTPSYGRP
jgi:hypothetical protein